MRTRMGPSATHGSVSRAENHLTPWGKAPKMQVTALRQETANCLQSRCSSQLSYVPWA